MQNSLFLTGDVNSTFINVPRCLDLANANAEIAVIGVPMVTAYSSPQKESSSDQEYGIASPKANPGEAPKAIRDASRSFTKYAGNFDFDLQAPLSLDSLRIVDCGDIPNDKGNDVSLSERTTNAIELLVDQGVFPIVLGGDHSTTYPSVRGLKKIGSLCLVQIDAHMDFRDEIAGFKEGYASPIRRSAELDWVVSIAQIGLRGWGAARLEDIDDAERMGSVIVTAEEIHDRGMESAIRKIPSADNYYITLDIDGFDPSIAPGVLFPSHGGLTYYQVTKLLRGVCRRGRVVGMDLVEVTPKLDINQRTSILAARMILTLIGLLSENGSLG